MSLYDWLECIFRGLLLLAMTIGGVWLLFNIIEVSDESKKGKE